jgi:2'-5' RNA ligase
VFLVPEAEALVQSWRAAHDPSAAEGMPAHITVLYPFLPEPTITAVEVEELEAICREAPAVPITFRRLGRFPSVLWLDPDSAACGQFIQRVQDHWNGCPPYGDPHREVIPHLTVADGVDADVMRRAEEAIQPRLPLRTAPAALSLMAFDGRHWVVRHQFPLTGDA